MRRATSTWSYAALFSLLAPWMLGGCMGKEGPLQASPLPLRKSPHAVSQDRPRSSILVLRKPTVSQGDHSAGKEKGKEKERASSAAHRKEAEERKIPIFYHGSNGSEKVVALTFDDGPDLHYTPQILDILKREGVKATFFVVGEMVPRHAAVLKRIDQEGHTIGNHTWDHAQLTKIPAARVSSEVTQTTNVVQRLLGKRPLLFRPPYGALNSSIAQQLHGLHYSIIQWSIDTRDWKSPSAKKIIRTIKRQVRPGSIILQHSLGGKRLRHTVEALPTVIRDLKKKGYRFVTIDRMFSLVPYEK